MIYNNILEAMGNTPLIRLERMAEEGSAQILVKFEGLNVGGSIKTRTAYNMIRDGRIKAHKVGREWRFFRSDLNAYLNSTSSLAMAAKGGSLDKSDLLTIQEELNKRSKHND